MNPTIELMRNHRSIRRFTDKAIEKNHLNAMIEAGQSASTSSYLQAYSVVRVTDRDKREKLALWVGNQKYVDTAAEFLVFCADLNRLFWACEVNGKAMSTGWTELTLIAAVDAALMGQNVLLAAESLGYGGVFIGGIRNNPDKVSDLLGLPDQVFPVFGMCLGEPDQNPDPKPRLPLTSVLMDNEYQEPDQAVLGPYDEHVKAYYINRTGGKIDHTWTQQVSGKLTLETRPHMKTYLTSKKLSER